MASSAVDPSADSKSESAVSRFVAAAANKRGLSPHTLAAYRADLTALVRWLAARNVPIAYATRVDLEEFLAERRRAAARPSSIARQFFSARCFFDHLLHEGVIRENPTAEIASPRIQRELPRPLTEQEVETLLSAPVLTDPLGMRDRIMLELLYATGLRISELVNLRLGHIDANQRLIRFVSKGKRERVILLGEERMRALREYIGGAREEILGARQTDYLFPTRRSDRIMRQAFWLIMKRYALRAGMTKELSPHALRYALAAHLLHGGADRRVVQRLLGHSDWSTRQIYRQVLSERLKNSA